jgi:hypothetical protein
MPREYAAALDLLKFRGFGQTPSPFLFAAIPWSSAETPPSLQAAQVFQSAWVGVFPFTLAFAGVAAARGLDLAATAARAAAERQALTDAGLPAEHRGGAAASVLVAVRHPSPDTVERTRQTWTLWNSRHRWLTGEDDLPFAVLHALAPGDVESRSEATEDVFRRLNKAGYARSNLLQLASQVGGLSPLPPAEFITRMSLVGGALKDRGWPFVRYRPVELALLSLCDGLPFALARDYAANERLMLSLPDRPEPIVASALAALLTATGRPGLPDGVNDALVLIGASSPLWGGV